MQNQSTKGYSVQGEEIQDLNSESCLAKCIYSDVNKTAQFFVRESTNRPTRHRIYNPYAHRENVFEFRKVREEVFNSYILFLQSKNEFHLRAAERALI